MNNDLLGPQKTFTSSLADKKILGADPGKAGALAVIDGRLNVYGLRAMPNNCNGRDILKFAMKHNPDLICVEKVGSRPKDGHMNSFQFGKNTGKLIGALECCNKPVTEVHPATWKANLKLSKSGKQGSVRLANYIFPGIKLIYPKDEGLAEALLIAYWLLIQQPIAE